MRFRQIDQITLLEPGKRIEARKFLSGGEDYLRDHFPRFPVMPGVLMLEALFQAASLLIRATDNYQCGLVLLRAAKNVKFSDFVQPGETLEISAEILKQDHDSFTIKASGQKGGHSAVTARLVVDRVPPNGDSPVDQHASLYMRQMTKQLQQAAVAGD